MSDHELDGYWKDVRPSGEILPDPSVDHAVRLGKAVECYRQRHDHKSPDGRRDSGGRWYPSEHEHQECCRNVRRPSAAYPWSLYHHCKTGGHIANLFGVTEKELRDAVKKPAQPRPRYSKGPTVWDKLSKEDEDEVGHRQDVDAA